MTLFQQIKEGLSDMLYIWAKEMRNVFTDEGVLIFFILVPLGYPLLYSWIYNNEVIRETPVAIVDMDHSALSREYIRKVDASPDVSVAYYCNSVDEGKDLVGRQEVRGVIFIPSDFAKKVKGIVHEEYPYPYCYTACDASAKGSEYYNIQFTHPQTGDTN